MKRFKQNIMKKLYLDTCNCLSSFKYVFHDKINSFYEGIQLIPRELMDKINMQIISKFL